MQIGKRAARTMRQWDDAERRPSPGDHARHGGARGAVPTSRRSAALAIAAIAVAGGLAACGPSTDAGLATDTPTPSSTEVTTSGAIPSVDSGPPLPADARVQSLSDLPTERTQDCNPLETLRPDPAAEPKDLVPQIYERGRLIVGLDQGSNLFSFRDPVSGELEGFDVDLAREIARDIFGDPSRVEFRSLTSAERINALANHRVDVVVKSMSITCDRKKQVRFSAPYFSANQRLLTLRGSDITSLSDLTNKRVCVAQGTTSSARLAQEAKNLTVLTVNTWADCLVAIQQGQVDAVTTDDAILAGMVAQDPNLQIIGESFQTEPYGVGIAKDTPALSTDGLARQVNSTLERIRNDGTWRRMYNRWLAPYSSNAVMPSPEYVDSEDPSQASATASSSAAPSSSAPTSAAPSESSNVPTSTTRGGTR
ncbi:glutamate ABC transporter substrate-binding protein [Dietzia sp.]|uniref:glutamate ABC transporter substrate-binding protein n=1 Tax=Dietzia sp. TaxID=1871616 RepID=UPI002FDAA3BD